MRVSRYLLTVPSAALLIVLALVFSGCGESTDTASNDASNEVAAKPTEKPDAESTPKPKPVVVTPLTCLEKLGYEDAEDRGGGTWRGDNGEVFVIVKKHGSSSEAKSAARSADLVAAASGGKYAVTAPGSDPSDRMDQTFVKAVAACVKLSK